VAISEDEITRTQEGFMEIAITVLMIAPATIVVVHPVAFLLAERSPTTIAAGISAIAVQRIVRLSFSK
jgi:hypothetical protein